MSIPSFEGRVIILGGGLAGLRCAQTLIQHGVSRDHVVLLEASSRIGGRIKTDKSFIEGFSLDLGAELIHGDETSLYRLAQEKGWEMEEIISLAQGDGGPLPADSNQGFGLFYLGGEKRMLAMSSKDPAFVHLNEYLGSLSDLWPAIKLKRGKEDRQRQQGNKATLSSSPAEAVPAPAPAAKPAPPRPPQQRSLSAPALAAATESVPPRPPQQRSLSLRDGLLGAGVGEVMMGLADAGYANTVGAALEDTSLMGTCFIEHEWDVDGDRTFVLKGSLGQVVDELGAGLESCIRTEWPVASVDYPTAGSATVTCRDGRFERGTHVVSALPLSIFHDGDVEFSPSLPEPKVSAYRCMGLCSAVKVILKFDRAVLPPLLHGCICSESFIPEFWFRHMPNLPEEGCYTMVAVGFAAGPKADAVSALKPEEALQKALAQLDDMFGGRKWLKGGGCTGKGDWEGGEARARAQAGEEAAAAAAAAQAVTEEGDPKRCQTGGVCGMTDAADGAEHGKPRKHDPTNNNSMNSNMNSIERAGEGSAPVRPADPGELWVTSDEEGATGTPSEAYTGGLVHDWVRDEPYVRGGYSYPKFGFDENTHADAAASVNGCLFFAGEHTNTPTGMTVHAAINSGERAALEVLRAVRGEGVTVLPTGATEAP